MPLFKGRGCKSTPTKAIGYITDPEKAEIVSTLNLDDSENYSKQFRATAKIYGKGNKYENRKYYHFKVSCDRGDNVDPISHHQYAEDLAGVLFSGYECIIATHTDTKTVHSHIIVNSVSFETGKMLHLNDKEYGAMKDKANELGAERGFSVLDFRKPAARRVATAERIVELKGGTSWKQELREVIDLAKQDTTDIESFEKYLNDYGVTLTRNTEKTISYRHPKKKKGIRGERLGSDYTKGSILNVFDKQQRTDRKGTAPAESGAEQNGNREHATQTGVSRVSDELRAISERVQGYSATSRRSKTTREKRMELALQAKRKALGIEGAESSLYFERVSEHGNKSANDDFEISR